jgi:hypothetical protein
VGNKLHDFGGEISWKKKTFMSKTEENVGEEHETGYYEDGL